MTAFEIASVAILTFMITAMTIATMTLLTLFVIFTPTKVGRDKKKDVQSLIENVSATSKEPENVTNER